MVKNVVHIQHMYNEVTVIKLLVIFGIELSVTGSRIRVSNLFVWMAT